MSELFPANTTFSVTEITSLIKSTLEGCFSSIIIEGEISNFKPSTTGHWYFTLKDENAAISAVMFKGKSRNLDFIPRDGRLVKASGTISVYAMRGSYQIIVDSMEQAGTGDILKIIEERKQKLAAEGLFDESNKKPLPPFPSVIGVVTSPTGAALQDIINVMHRRNDAVSIIVLPCQVQGEAAAAAIVRQIENANRFHLVDVLIVGRGGGSLEDLLPFSDEQVVRAVAASDIPVVSAVGHEIDFSLSDFAADRRAPTPSAAAELVTPLKSDILQTLTDTSDTLYSAIETKLSQLRLMVRSFSAESLELRFRSIELPLLQRFDYAKEDLLSAIEERIQEAKHRLEIQTRQIENNNPQSILSRGYAVVRRKDSGHIVRTPNDVQSGTELYIYPANGIIEATVTGENT